MKYQAFLYPAKFKDYNTGNMTKNIAINKENVNHIFLSDKIIANSSILEKNETNQKTYNLSIDLTMQNITYQWLEVVANISYGNESEYFIYEVFENYSNEDKLNNIVLIFLITNIITFIITFSFIYLKNDNLTKEKLDFKDIGEIEEKEKLFQN